MAGLTIHRSRVPRSEVFSKEQVWLELVVPACLRSGRRDQHSDDDDGQLSRLCHWHRWHQVSLARDP